MAKTIDEIVVKTSVEGAQTLDQLNARLNSIDESAKKTATAMNQVQGGVRNTAYQIQDLAVQIAGGTNAFVAFGQQLPQLLSAFGTTGIVVGAVAAVTIPLLQVGLKAAGVDMRNLGEMTKDLTDKVSKFQEAQKENMATTQGLSAAYGDAAGSAKKFFEIQQSNSQARVLDDQKKTLDELVKTYSRASQDIAFFNKMGAEGSKVGPGDLTNTQVIRAKWLGLSIEQAKELSRRLGEIDTSNPTKSVDTISEITKWLTEATKESSKFSRVSESIIIPLENINKQLIKQQENLRASAQEASDFATAILRTQNDYGPKINDAKRNFDQVNAARLEGEQKTAELMRQIQEKNKKDGLSRESELAEGVIRIQQETADKIKDFAKGQSEAYISQRLSNVAKQSQLVMEGEIANLQLKQLDSLSYSATLEEKVLKNIYDQQLALSAVLEMRRKNQVSEDQAKRLTEQIIDLRKKADDNAEKANIRIAAENERSIRIQVEGLELQNTIKQKSLDLEIKSFGLSSLRQATEKQLLDIQNARDKEIQTINNNSKLSDSEKLDALIRINEQYQKSKDLAEDEYNYRKKLSESFNAGAQDRIKGIVESFDNFKTAGMMVDAVWNNMSSALDNFVTTGKLNFSDFARSVIYDLEKIALKSAVIGVFKSMGLADLFSLPAKATGGPVAGDTAYMVGEQGPELFIPTNAGKIIPNNQLRGGGGTSGGNTIINNISAIDAKSVAQLFAENRMTLFGTVEQARRELPMRTR